MLGTWESEVKCETCGYDCCADFTQWNCKLQTGGKITRKVGGWDIVNYTPVSFWHVIVQHAHGREGQHFAGN